MHLEELHRQESRDIDRGEATAIIELDALMEDSAIYRVLRENGRFHYSCEPLPGGEVMPPGSLEWRSL